MNAMSQRVSQDGLLVVSPHCDDAVLACGALLATLPGSSVVTVFAGSPPSYDPMTEWDRSAGFRTGEDVMRCRREEDRRALERLGAMPVWLDFLDSQYGRSPAVQDIAAALARIVDARAPRTIAFPLGLYHSDHVLAHGAALSLVPRYSNVRWLLYEDTFYRHIPGAVATQRTALTRAGYVLRDVEIATSEEAERVKREAIQCYASQLKALATPRRPGHADAQAPERYAQIVRLPVCST